MTAFNIAPSSPPRRVAPWMTFARSLPICREALSWSTRTPEKHELNWNDETSSPPRLSGRRMGRWSALAWPVILAIAAYYLLGMPFIGFPTTSISPRRRRRGKPRCAGRWPDPPRSRRQSLDRQRPVGDSQQQRNKHAQGVIYALSRFAIEMSDQIGRTRGSSEVDKNLDKAAGLLKYPGDIWVFDLSTSLMPTATSKAISGRARELLAYNHARRRRRGRSTAGPTICRRPSTVSPIWARLRRPSTNI